MIEKLIDRAGNALCAASLITNAACTAAALTINDPVSFLIAYPAAVISGLAWMFHRGRIASRG